MKLKVITRTVWILSIVSLFTDTASEMLYPIMPIYLKTIGFSIVLIGVLEGFAEALAGLSKGYFGQLSDNSGKRVPFVQLGYALSTISKPMMAVFTFPLWIFFARAIDRFGKGIRTGARDAILSDEATPKTKGKIFGFHRSMDTIGAVIGPTLALVYLYFYPQDFTAGCTEQACTFRDNYDAIKKYDAVIFGVSADQTDSHRKFAASYHLPFPLISDADRSISKLYHARWLFGLWPYAKRVTYVIDKQGIIRSVIHHELNIGRHLGDVIEALKQCSLNS